MENQELDRCPCIAVSIHLNFLIHLLLLKDQTPVSPVQNLSQDEIILDVANVTSGRFLKGCAMCWGNGTVNNGSLLYLDVALKKLLPHLSSIFAFSLVSPKHIWTVPFQRHIQGTQQHLSNKLKKKKGHWCMYCFRLLWEMSYLSIHPECICLTHS